MKCPNYIKIEQVVGKKKSYEKIKNIIPPQLANSGSKYHEVTPEMQVCGGEIVCSVKADCDTDYYGNASSPELVVKYICKRCKADGFSFLPHTEEEVSVFLTQFFAGLTDITYEEVKKYRPWLTEEEYNNLYRKP